MHLQSSQILFFLHTFPKNHGESQYPQSTEWRWTFPWPAYRNNFKSTATTHPGGHKRKLGQPRKNCWPPARQLGSVFTTQQWERDWGENDIQGIPLLTKNNIRAYVTFAKYIWMFPQDFWENILGTDKMKVLLFGRCASYYIWRECNRSFQKMSGMAVVWWSGATALLQDLDDWLWLMKPRQ